MKFPRKKFEKSAEKWANSDSPLYSMIDAVEAIWNEADAERTADLREKMEGVQSFAVATQPETSQFKAGSYLFRDEVLALLDEPKLYRRRHANDGTAMVGERFYTAPDTRKDQQRKGKEDCGPVYQHDDITIDCYSWNGDRWVDRRIKDRRE